MVDMLKKKFKNISAKILGKVPSKKLNKSSVWNARETYSPGNDVLTSWKPSEYQKDDYEFSLKWSGLTLTKCSWMW